MAKANNTVDVVLIGGGIMSATLGSLISLLEPTWTIEIFERLDDVALESSNPWNNAGTGHAAHCELNYTSERPDGSIDISKAVTINEQFEVSREFWNHLVTAGLIGDQMKALADWTRQGHAEVLIRKLAKADAWAVADVGPVGKGKG